MTASMPGDAARGEAVFASRPWWGPFEWFGTARRAGHSGIGSCVGTFDAWSLIVRPSCVPPRIGGRGQPDEGDAMGIRELVDRVVKRNNQGIVAVQVPSLDPGGEPPLAFVPNHVYLEVRLQQMWLTRARELWREYLPFGTVVTEFVHKGQPVAVPTVLSSAELARRFQVTGADDAVEVGNIRIAGPVPYEGDEFSLLVALFRAKTTDWIARSLKVVEDVAAAVGFGGLAGAVPLASSLIRGIESFLESPDVELRVGAYRSWRSANGAPGGLVPLHFCVMRRPHAETAAADLAALRVSGGRLHRLSPGGTLEPYTEHDFILVSVEAKRERDDYRKLAFYPLWERTKEQVIAGDLTGAQRTWRQTAGALYSDDLTRPQQETLFHEYQRLYAELVDRFSDLEPAAYRGDQYGGNQYGGGPAPVPRLTDDPVAILRSAGA
jgi:hypothetical protein